ncbi:MAG: DUF2075 domain-containing protein [Acetobacteraceae bacterium]|nr:DUF2075 domain-containing protein [Acetobacteraceae bacterium]
MHAWWSGDVGDMLAGETEALIGVLSKQLVQNHTVNHATQLAAWQSQIEIVRHALRDSPDSWRVLFEYPLLRLGRRIDVAILTDRAVFVIEFKIGAKSFNNTDRQQVEDYALDLFDFHQESRGHPIVPILVATEAKPEVQSWPLLWHGVTPVLTASMASLKPLLADIVAQIPKPRYKLDAMRWEQASYRPVPTIVEAAQMLFTRHGVGEIAAARADVGNLTRTTRAIISAVQDASSKRRHVVLFVTGVPGAGKTLCGLNTVFGTDSGAAFLTGNLPLVHVLREALARDARDQGRSIRVARQEVESAIQPLIGFLRDNLPRSSPPHEHVIVFDEAQRAWDADFGRRKFGHAQSEAALFLDIMGRHPDWAVIVALVGTGQEINTGEAGLAAWGEALLERRNWTVVAAPDVLRSDDPRRRLFKSAPPSLVTDKALHLDVGIRSIRSTAAAPWVDAVLQGDAEGALKIANEAGGVPFLLTRSLDAMRAALRSMARGSRRGGLVCSAGARRLRADGIWPDFDHLDAQAVANWFLERWPDVRASDALELPATQFACQGLELDYVGLCWGNDLIRQEERLAWIPRNFVGTRWQAAQAEAKVAYKINTYRVLLTRARYTTIIWVPSGCKDDNTRDPKTFDAIAAFLSRCGISELNRETLDRQTLQPAEEEVMELL